MCPVHYYGEEKITKEENVLFNDILNTFDLQLYGVREKGNQLMSLHGLLLPMSNKGCFICTPPIDRIIHPTDRIIPTTAFVTLFMEH